MNCDLFPKQLFLSIMNTFLINPPLSGRSSPCEQMFITLTNYNLEQHFIDYVFKGVFPDKKTWNSIVNDCIISKHYESVHDTLSINENMFRYSLILKDNSVHPLWNILFHYPQCYLEIAFAVKLSCFRIRSDQCLLCNTYSYDIDKHVMLGCSKNIEERNNVFDTIVDIMDVTDFGILWQKDDDYILAFLFGANDKDIIRTDADTIMEIRLTYVKWLYKHRDSFPLDKLI